MKKHLFLIFVLVVMSLSGTVASAQEPGTIPEVAASTEGLATLAGALGLADPAALEMLSGEGPLTVFAPLDDAFSALDPEVASQALADMTLLTAILSYHVVLGAWTTEAIMAEIEASADGTFTPPTALPGASLVLSLDDDGNVVINDGEAMVTLPDVMASNGVIHGINAVLIPVMEAPMAPSYVMDIAAGELGSEDDPVVLMFIPSENSQEVQAGADDLAALLTEKTGIAITATVATDYAAAIEAMCSGEAEIGALAPYQYVLAHNRGCADVGVVSTRNGSPFYNAQFIVNVDSGIASYADLKGKVFCRPNPLSASGWIAHVIAMQDSGIDIDADLKVTNSGGHDGVVIAVYNGDCDAGGTFIDARTLVADDYPDVNDKVIVIAESAPIPNDTLSFSVDVSEDMRANLVSALVEISADEASAELLSAVYSWSGLEPAVDAFFDDYREQLDAAGVDTGESN